MMGFAKRTLTLLILLFFLAGGLVYAQEDSLSLKLALIGPGDELYFWWGHIGLLAEDRLTGQSWFFDWGVFDFHAENFFTNFAMGRLYYYCAASPAHLNFSALTAANRDIILYTLNLPMETKLEIMRFAENNILPQNRTYNYHHFRDNCATRIRDIIDLATGGQFYAEFGYAPSRFTLREQVRRHTWFNPFFDWFLSFLMGQGIDRPITVWDDMFLPSEIILRAENFYYTDIYGETRPLVTSVETVNLSRNRPIVLDEPKAVWHYVLIFSSVFSLLLFASYLIWYKRKCFRVSMGLINSALGFFFGLAGSMLFFMTFFTDHDYTYNNLNVIFVNPIILAAIPLGLSYGFSGKTKKRKKSSGLLAVLWLYVFLGGLLTIVLNMFPPFYLQNQVTLSLVLPIAFVMFLIMYKIKQDNR